jgi:hypothetical protein
MNSSLQQTQWQEATQDAGSPSAARSTAPPNPHCVSFQLTEWLERCSRSELLVLVAAAAQYEECRRALVKANSNIVRDVLQGCGEFVEYDHFPPEDVFDAESHAQYYYHAHRGLAGEHGHFHMFLRTPGMPTSVCLETYPGAAEWPRGAAMRSHTSWQCRWIPGAGR